MVREMPLRLSALFDQPGEEIVVEGRDLTDLAHWMANSFPVDGEILGRVIKANRIVISSGNDGLRKWSYQ